MGEKILETVCDAIIDEKSLWVISDAWNCLFRYDLEKRELECEAVFPREVQEFGLPFSKIIRMGNEIYFIPRIAKDIYYYDLIKKRFQNLNISNSFFREDNNIDVLIQGKYIYCVNRCPDTVLIIDSDTKAVKIFRAKNTQYINKKIENQIYRDYAKNSACFYEGAIIWPNYSNLLTVFNIQEEKFFVYILKGLAQERIERLQEEYEIEEMRDWIISVKSYKDALLLISYEGRVYLYDAKIHKVREILDYYRIHNVYDYKLPFWGGIISLNDELYFIPQFRYECLKYNYNTKECEKVISNYLKNWAEYKREYTVCVTYNEQIILLYSYYESCFYIINIKNDFIEKREISLSVIDLVKKNIAFIYLLPKLKRKEIDNIDFLLHQLYFENNEHQIEWKDYVTFGEKIYKALGK